MEVPPYRLLKNFRAIPSKVASLKDGRWLRSTYTAARRQAVHKLLVVVIADAAKPMSRCEAAASARDGRVASSLRLAQPVRRGESRHGEHGAVLEAGLAGTAAAHEFNSQTGTTGLARVQLQNQIESVLEEGRIQLSSVSSESKELLTTLNSCRASGCGREAGVPV
jgi:hypothetical protein